MAEDSPSPLDAGGELALVGGSPSTVIPFGRQQSLEAVAIAFANQQQHQRPTVGGPPTVLQHQNSSGSRRQLLMATAGEDVRGSPRVSNAGSTSSGGNKGLILYFMKKQKFQAIKTKSVD
jgi:hypothetical protein